MRILVTGGTGGVGRGVVARLVSSGHEVRVVDLRAGQQEAAAGVEYVACDITNFAALREQARGMEGIVHLAAYPNPVLATGPEMFRVNCGGTYNVFEAAAQEGIRRVACASSINALGFNFGVKSFPIQYFPMDENHPTCTTDPYSFSKQVTETIAAYYWRRDGISSTCLRMPYVYTLDGDQEEWTRLFLQSYPDFFARLAGMEPGEQQHNLERMKAGLEEARRKRMWEKQDEEGWEDFDWQDPALMANFGYTDFWSVISVEDTAQAFEKSLLADFEGSHALYVSEGSNVTGVESEALLRVFYPEVTARRRAIPGASTILSYDQAQALIGYQPEFNLRERL